MNEQRIVFLDVCGTLTKTNNTFDFIAFVVKEDGLRSLLLKLVKLFGARSAAVGFLKGYSVKDIESKSKEYVAALEKRGLFNKEMLKVIEDARIRGARLIFLSASIDPPVKEIAKRLGVPECYTSELEVAGGLYTGRIARDLLGRKELALNSIGGFSKDSSVFYTDNEEDLALRDTFGRIVPMMRTAHKDIASINDSNRFLSYIPSFYYILSRFHLRGCAEVVARDIVPVFLIVWSSGGLGLFASAVAVFLSFFMFYSIYEIGGLYNDLYAKNEKGHNPVHRIADDVKINIIAFVGIRILFFAVCIMYLRLLHCSFLPFAAALFICLCVYVIHTKADGHVRIFTYACLRAFRIAIPLIPFYTVIPFFHVFAAFFMINFPKPVYAYIAKREDMANILRNPLWNVMYYVCAISVGIAAYFMTNCGVYLFVGPYLFLVDSISFLLRRARSYENSHI